MERYRLKIKKLPEIKEEIERLKTGGKRIVFTNGCFDILHPGHTRYLDSARALGDYLIVGGIKPRSRGGKSRRSELVKQNSYHRGGV